MKNIRKIYCFILLIACTSVSFAQQNSEVLNFKFDEPVGQNIYDLTSGGHTGQLINGATRFKGVVEGNKLETDGVDDYLLVKNTPDLNFGKDSFSISLMFRLNSVPKTASAPILSKQDPVSKTGYVIYIEPSLKIAAQGRSNNSKVRYAETTTDSIQLGKWYSLIVIFDRVNGYRIYLDGIKQGTTVLNNLSAQSEDMNNSADFIIGANPANNNYGSFRMDHFSLYNFILNDQQIQNILKFKNYQGLPTPLPNFVVIVTDDQEQSSLVNMPKVRDYLTENGVTFVNSFVDFPLCCPSRSTFLTGQSAQNHQILGNLPELDGGYGKFAPSQGNTLPVWLKRNGYKTAIVGKYLNGYGDDAQSKTFVPPGWDIWNVTTKPDLYYNFEMNEDGKVVTYDKGEYLTDFLSMRSANYINAQKNSNEPFFLYITPLAPHTGRNVTDTQNPPPATRHKGIYASLRLPMSRSFNEKDISDKPAFLRQAPLLATSSVVSHFINRQETLLAVDDLVENVYLALEKSGKLNNTYIIFTSDNGYFNGEHRKAFHKNLAYEEALRVPLVITGPNIPLGINRSEIVSNVDLAATIVDLANATPKRTLDGMSLKSLFSNSFWIPWRSALLFQGLDQNVTDPKKFDGRYQGVRTINLKYIKHTTGEEELYNLSTDPLELQSLHNVQSYQSIKNDLSNLLTQLKTCSGTSCWHTGPVGTILGLGIFEYYNLLSLFGFDK